MHPFIQCHTVTQKYLLSAGFQRVPGEQNIVPALGGLLSNI